MLYVTGDVHADMKDFNSRPYGRLKKDDAVIVCGDFGILWDGSKAEQKNIRSIGKKHHGTYFIDGSHENFDLLAGYPVTPWNGGKAQVISGNLVHLMRGQVYLLGGKKVFTFGGGESPDKEMRTERQGWWREELPSQEEMDEGIRNLEQAGWEVDYIFTHDAPTIFKKLMDSDDADLNVLNVYLEGIREKLKYRKWIFGNYHINRRLAPSLEAVFDGVVKLGDS